MKREVRAGHEDDWDKSDWLTLVLFFLMFPLSGVVEIR